MKLTFTIDPTNQYLHKTLKKNSPTAPDFILEKDSLDEKEKLMYLGKGLGKDFLNILSDIEKKMFS